MVLYLKGSQKTWVVDHIPSQMKGTSQVEFKKIEKDSKNIFDILKLVIVWCIIVKQYMEATKNLCKIRYRVGIAISYKNERSKINFLKKKSMKKNSINF